VCRVQIDLGGKIANRQIRRNGGEVRGDNQNIVELINAIRPEEDPNSEENMQNKLIKYSKKVSNLNKMLYFKQTKFFGDFLRILQPMTGRSILSFEGAKLTVNPCSNSIHEDEAIVENIRSIFKRAPNQKCTGLSTLGSSAINSPYDSVCEQRMDILTTAIKLYYAKRKAKQTKATLKIQNILQWRRNLVPETLDQTTQVHPQQNGPSEAELRFVEDEMEEVERGN